MDDLHGKVALVTGASRGIGRAIALELAAAGADLVLTARTLDAPSWLPGTLLDTAHSIEALGRRAFPVRADLSRIEEIEHLIAEARKAFAHVDVLVNNAAFLGRAAYYSLEQLSLRDWERQLAVNLTAPFLLCKALAPEMAARGWGRILNITSDAGLPREFAVPGLVYGATKGALNAFSIALNRDLRPTGVAVLVLDPGYTRTEIAVHAEQASGTDIDDAHGVDVPARAAAYLAACADPQRYGGRVVVAAELVSELDREEA
jgi:3-oxoacyl-[acyl-carrier protein] reductase